MGQNAEHVYEDRPAPGRLDALRMLLNTDDRFHGFDRFDDLERLHPFLVHYGVLAEGEALDASGAGRVRDFRDTVRAFLVHPDAATIAAVEAVAERHPLVVRLGGGGSVLAAYDPRHTADRVVADQLATLHHAVDGGQWSRLGVCGRDECQWIFYDSSRNRSARWCSADPCAAVMKSRAWRERQKSLAD